MEYDDTQTLEDWLREILSTNNRGSLLSIVYGILVQGREEGDAAMKSRLLSPLYVHRTLLNVGDAKKMVDTVINEQLAFDPVDVASDIAKET